MQMLGRVPLDGTPFLKHRDEERGVQLQREFVQKHHPLLVGHLLLSRLGLGDSTWEDRFTGPAGDSLIPTDTRRGYRTRSVGAILLLVCLAPDQSERTS